MKLINKKFFIIFFFVFTCFFGDLIILPGPKIMGITITLYRVFIPIIFLLCIYRELRYKSSIKISKLMLCAIFVLMFMIVYGFGAMMISPYVPASNGFKELLSLLYSIMIMFCAWYFCRNDDDRTMVKALCFFLIVVVILSLAEYYTGYHFSTSRFMYSPKQAKIIPGLNMCKSAPMVASTGIFYNENDLCAFLVIFMPFLFMLGGKLSKHTVKYLFCLLILALIVFNDATICLAAFAVALLAYILSFLNLSKIKHFRNVMFVLMAFIVVLPFISPIIMSVIDGISYKFNSLSNSRSTLAIRIITSLRSIETAFDSYGLGIGPAAFTDYFSVHYPNNYVYAPHNFLFEVLSEYGVINFTLVVTLWIVLIIKLIKQYRRTKEQILAVLIAAMLSFCLACLAPSSFIGYSYTWLLVGVCVGYLDNIRINLNNHLINH